MRNKTLTALSIIGFASMVSTQAKAQNIEHALQLGLGTNFLTYSSTTLTQDVSQPDPNDPRREVTVQYKTVNRTTEWGLSNRSGINLEAGYGITDSLVLGGILQLGGWSNTTGPKTITNGDPRITNSTFSLFIGPKLDFMLLPDSMVRPFVGAAIGLVRQTYSIEQETQNNVTTNPANIGTTGVGLLARAGVRWFLTPGFSIDPALVFGVNTGSGSTEHPNGQGRQSDDTTATGYSIGLSLAFSGWIGI
jgi:opacity protein-like surface antigen